MITSDSQYKTRIAVLYDQYVNAHPDGVTVAESHKFLTAQLARELELEPRNLEREAADLVHAHLPGLRRARTQTLRQELSYVADWLNGIESPDINIASLMTTSFATGRAEGLDKALKYWTQEDLTKWLEIRMRNKEATRLEYEQSEKVVVKLAKAMERRGILMLGAASEAVSA